MNAFTNYKCHAFGKMAVREAAMSWESMIETKEWKDFVRRRELTKSQIFFIHRGYNGLPMESTEMRDKEESGNLDDELFPFGTHKGKRMSEVPDKYIHWVSEQDWLSKWAIVSLYVKQWKQKRDEGKLSKEEIAEILRMEY